MKAEKGLFLPAVRDRFCLGPNEPIKAHIIVSGAPKGRKRRTKHQHIIQEELDALGIETTLHMTKSATNAIELTENAIKSNAHIIVYYSGDGGFHTGVNVQERLLGQAEGMKDLKGKHIEKPINIFVPGGTMDIDGRANRIPRRNVPKAMDALLRGEVVKRDLVRMQAGDVTKYGVVLAGTGAAAKVTHYVDSSGKRGPQRYFIESMQHRNDIQPRDVIIANKNTFRDVYEIPAWVVEVMNGGPYGGWFHTIPQNARMDDGLLDLFAVEPDGAFFPQALKLAVRTALRGRYPNIQLPDNLRGMRGSHLEVATADGKAFGLVHTDGETFHTEAARLIFDARVHALNQLVPARS